MFWSKGVQCKVQAVVSEKKRIEQELSLNSPLSLSALHRIHTHDTGRSCKYGFQRSISSVFFSSDCQNVVCQTQLKTDDNKYNFCILSDTDYTKHNHTTVSLQRPLIRLTNRLV